MTLDATGTVDATTGIATIGGTASCNERSVVYREGVLRQLRQGLFIARGYWGTQIVCTPDGTNEWSVEVDTDTGVAFGAGSAQVKYSFVYASDGFREFTSAELEDETIQLQSA
jgi:hypothetical protein